MEEGALEELAVEEILKDLKRGAERAKEHGALGWQKNPAPPTNKRFLRNMLVSTLRDDRPQSKKRKFNIIRQQSSSSTSVTVTTGESASNDAFSQDHAHSRTANDDHCFRYNDRYKSYAHSNSDKQQSGSSYKDLPSHSHQQWQLSKDSRPKLSSQSKRNSSTENGSSISLTDSRLDLQKCEALSSKRLYSTSSDSNGEKKGEKTQHQKKRHRKTRKCSRKDSEDWSVKKKHTKSKKSKKSKKRKVKKCHRSKDF